MLRIKLTLMRVKVVGKESDVIFKMVKGNKGRSFMRALTS